MTADEFVQQVLTQPTERDPSGSKSLAGIILEENCKLLGNFFKVMNVDTGGSGSYASHIKRWDRSTVESIDRHVQELMNNRVRQQRATMLRRQVLLVLRENQDTTVTLEQFAREYYRAMKEYNMLNLLRP